MSSDKPKPQTLADFIQQSPPSKSLGEAIKQYGGVTVDGLLSSWAPARFNYDLPERNGRRSSTNPFQDSNITYETRMVPTYPMRFLTVDVPLQPLNQALQRAVNLWLFEMPVNDSEKIRDKTIWDSIPKWDKPTSKPE